MCATEFAAPPTGLGSACIVVSGRLAARSSTTSQGKTLVSVSTLDKDMRERVKAGGNKAAAAIVGKAIAEKSLQAGIKEVRFDRGPCKYHGRVASLADAAREAGLVF